MQIQLNANIKAISEINGDLSFILNGIDEEGELIHCLDKEYKNLSFTINYPLGKDVVIIIEKANMLSDILVPIAMKYKEIYNVPEKYGVWGHVFDDLFFESISIKDDEECELIVGS